MSKGKDENSNMIKNESIIWRTPPTIPQIKETSAVIVNNLDKMIEYAKLLLKSGFLPKHIATPEQVITIIAKGRELNIPDMQALSSIYVVNGVPVLSGQLMLALIHRSKQLEDMKVEYDSEGNCFVTMKRVGRSPVTTSFTWNEAKRLGLSEKDNYKKQPETMFMWRAVAKNARINFSDVIGGCYAFEEIDSVILNEEGEVVKIEQDSNSEISDYVKQRISNYNDFMIIDLNDYEKISKKIQDASSKEEMLKISEEVKSNYQFMDKRLLAILRDEYKKKFRTFEQDNVQTQDSVQIQDNVQIDERKSNEQVNEKNE